MELLYLSFDLVMRWDRSLGVTRLRYYLDDWGIGFRFVAGTKDFYHFCNVQTDSKAHPASYSTSTGVYFPRVKAAAA
jgi:hypothetical protein